MIFLLDVNVLIALLDTRHVSHRRAHHWFDSEVEEAWATCPITQNGVLRIVGGSRYANFPGSPAVVAQSLKQSISDPRHRFWDDSLSLVDDAHIDPSRLNTSTQITDTYLLALAVVNGGQLATFDRRLVVDAVKGGRQALHVIEP